MGEQLTKPNLELSQCVRFVLKDICKLKKVPKQLQEIFFSCFFNEACGGRLCYLAINLYGEAHSNHC
jgi:hypothetical protein